MILGGHHIQITFPGKITLQFHCQNKLFIVSQNRVAEWEKIYTLFRV